MGIDINPAFAEFARQAIAREPLTGRVEILEMPALSYQGEPGRFDVTLCIRASFALGRFASAVDWLTRMTASGGFWRSASVRAGNRSTGFARGIRRW